ncbi:MAG: energy-coupling factor ABC transporter ATP-binding protein, partial [Candidatus Bathyarchaeia archaeon]
MSRTEESELLIHADCLTHIYPDGTKGIHCMYLRVYAHEIVCLCGPNGSGKSTLLEHLNGLLLPTDGILKVFGKRIDAQNLRELRKEVGLVFQDAESQLFSPPIPHDVMFRPLNLGLSREEARKRALWALETVGFKEYEKVPHYLSGGEKKLVAIAGVLAMRPRIIALDEPTADLDSRNSRRIEELVVKARDELGMSVVVAHRDGGLIVVLLQRRVDGGDVREVLELGDPRPQRVDLVTLRVELLAELGEVALETVRGSLPGRGVGGLDLRGGLPFRSVDDGHDAG